MLRHVQGMSPATYAGPIGRVVALTLDVSISGALFAGMFAGLSWIAAAVVGVDIGTDRSGLVWLISFVTWLFLYHWVGPAR